MSEVFRCRVFLTLLLVSFILLFLSFSIFLNTSLTLHYLRLLLLSFVILLSSPLTLHYLASPFLCHPALYSPLTLHHFASPFLCHPARASSYSPLLFLSFPTLDTFLPPPFCRTWLSSPWRLVINKVATVTQVCEVAGPGRGRWG